MNIVEHAGVTVAAIFAADQAVRLTRSLFTPRLERQQGVETDRITSRFGFLVDYRALFVGSILPDLIDKPLVWLAPELVNNSLRSVGHSWTLPVFLFLAGFASAGWGRRLFLWLGIGSVAHLVLDQMWTMPEVLAWPLLGWAFPAGSTPVHVWWAFQWRRFDVGPIELATVLLFVVIGLRVIWRRQVTRFLRTGTL